MKSFQKYLPYIAIGTFFGLLSAGGVGYLVHKQTQERETLKAQIAALTSERDVLSVQLGDAQDLVEDKEGEIEGQLEFIATLRQQLEEATSLEELAQMVRGTAEVAGTLKKLSETDEELLAKYSKVYFLNEHYEPDDLKKIDDDWTDNKKLQLKAQVVPQLEDMLEAMADDDLEPLVVSAYRSYAYQSSLKEHYKVTYGSGANAFSADQGYSEHQLGTTVDIIEQGNDMNAFAQSDEYQWLTEHAHEYGFVLSYPEDNAYYVFEPWHWRYVGVRLAAELHERGVSFYDMPQREINEYLLDLFE